MSSLYALIVSAVPLSPRSNGSLICGEKGWDAGVDSFLSFTYITDFSDCERACSYHSSQCRSFAYYVTDPVNYVGDCELYNVPAGGNFVPDDSIPHKFYDQGCMIQEEECGVAGYSKTDSSSYDAIDTLADCVSLCLDYGSFCISYLFADGYCYMYDYLVADNVISDSSSPYIFYDALCAQSTTTTTTTTTKTTKTSMKVLTTTTTIKSSTTSSFAPVTTSQRSTSSSSTKKTTSIISSMTSSKSSTLSASSTNKTTTTTIGKISQHTYIITSTTTESTTTCASAKKAGCTSTGYASETKR